MSRFFHIYNSTFKINKWSYTTIVPTSKLFQALIDEGDSLAYITGRPKLYLVELLVLYLFSTAPGKKDCRYGGLIWCVILTSCKSLWFCGLVLRDCWGGGPRVVVSTAAFQSSGSLPGLGGLKETKNVSSPSTSESHYCGEPPCPRGSVLGLRPPGLEFRILCLEDSVISIISPSSGGTPGPV